MTYQELYFKLFQHVDDHPSAMEDREVFIEDSHGTLHPLNAIHVSTADGSLILKSVPEEQDPDPSFEDEPF